LHLNCISKKMNVSRVNDIVEDAHVRLVPHCEDFRTMQACTASGLS
jgi:hypothetical protein